MKKLGKYFKQICSIVLALIMLVQAVWIPSLASEASGEKPKLNGKSISILGDSISTFEGVSNSAEMNATIGNNNVYYNINGIIPEQKLTYWGRVIDKYGLELCVNNSTGGGKTAIDVEGSNTRFSGVKRSTELHNVNGKEPEVIVVFLGTNDFGDANISLSQFATAYKQMLDNALGRYENAELFCCTLLPRADKEIDQTEFKKYNSKIRQIVGSYLDRVTLVDMYKDSGITWDNLELYTFDKLHPNKAGAELMSKVLEDALSSVYTLEPPVTEPTATFDLTLDVLNNSVGNAASSNVSVTKEGASGEVKVMPYMQDGKLYQIPVYYAAKNISGNSYLKVNYEDITDETLSDGEKEEKLREMIFDNGITLECFLWVDGATTVGPAGIMASMNGGGIGLVSATRGEGTNFRLGTYDTTDSTYIWDANKYVASNKLGENNILKVGRFSHVVATYDQVSKKMSLYMDGELVGSGDYGSGDFKPIQDSNQKDKTGFFGIGTNLAALGESLDDEMNYAIADARIYSGALSAKQVENRYDECWNEVSVGAKDAVYFDLNIKDTNNDGTLEINNVGTNEATITPVNGGELTTMDVLYNGQVCKVPVYSAESLHKGENGTNHSYLKVEFSGLGSEEQLSNWLLDYGSTFECFLYVKDEIGTEQTVGIMSNNSSGGYGLYHPKAAEGLNFIVGTETGKTAKYPYASNTDVTYACAVKHGVAPRRTLDAGKITHVVGTITKDSAGNNILSFYKNGKLISQGEFGDGPFNAGTVITKNILGIGANAGAPKEALNYYTDYAILDARVYSYGLSEDEVAQQYQNRWNEVASYAVASDSVTDLAPTVVDGFSSVTGTSQSLGEEMPGYVYESLDSYVGCFDGESTTPGTTDSKTYVFETTNKTYLSFLKSLQESGWQQYSNNVEQNNLFATYTKGEKSIYAYYIANKGYAYITVSDNCELENRAVDNTYQAADKKCKPQFTEMKLVDSGNAEILRLSDGRFIVIDGGDEKGDEYYQAKRIYKVLEEQNVLDKITIAAWIVTHPHTDHMYGCRDFLNIYGSDKVIIEEMIFHFPTQADGLAEQSSLADSLPGFWEAVNGAKAKWPNMKIVKCHTGQEFYFADAKIEILHTITDYFPKKVNEVVDGINDSSIAFSIEIAGQKIMMFGDIGTSGSDSLVTMWGDYLKADMSSVSHHGMHGGSVELYEHIDPVVAFIPATRGMWNTTQLTSHEATEWLLTNGSGNIKEIIYAGFGTRTLELPYTPEASGPLVKNESQNGYEMEEPDKVVAEPSDKLYMDLEFEEDGTLKDSTEKNTFTTNGAGTVGKNIVYYKGKAYEVLSYRSEKTSTGTAKDRNYITVNLNNMKSLDDLRNFLLDGYTFELFFALDEPTGVPNDTGNLKGTAGLMASASSGGVALYARNCGTLGFQMGNTSDSSEKTDGNGNYAWTKYSYGDNRCNIELGKTVTHVVATYDATDEVLRLYQNGVLISEGKCPNDADKFKHNSVELYNQLGIGYNAAYAGEELSRYTGYTIINSRIYSEPLSDEQVAAEYWNSITELTSHKKPEGLAAVNETIKGKADGKITGLTTAMEYSTDGTTYTTVTDADMTFAAGTYAVRVAASGNYNASEAVSVTIHPGKELTVTLPSDQVGYTLTSTTSKLDWHGDATITFTLKDGYSKISSFAVKVNGSKVELDSNNQYALSDVEGDLVITVEGVADSTPASAEITVAENKWFTLLNQITFNIFFKNTQTVKVTATDAGSGVESIYYYLSNEAVADDKMGSITAWQEYTNEFKINPDNKYVIYVKVVDKAGNISYISSEGIVLDATTPAITNVENGKDYYGNLTFTVADTYLDTVTVDGQAVTLTNGQYTIAADNQKHKVVATDKAGNETKYEFTVYKIYTVTFIVDGNEYKREQVNHGSDVTLPEIPTKEGYDKVAPSWDKDGKNVTSDLTITAVYTINPGDYVDATPATNVGGSKFDNTMEELKQAIPFTQEELELVKNGEDAQIWLVVNDITSTVTPEEKVLIANKVPGHTVGLYFDASIFKQVGTNNPEKVTKLDEPITVKMSVPDELINKDDKMVREYVIVRIHNGEAAAIKAEFHAETKELTFETDRFSTYALAYKDTEKNPESTDDKNQNPTDSGQKESVQTGDTTAILPFVVLMIVFAGVAIIILKSKRRGHF